MSALSGFEGALYYDGVQIANVRNWSVTVNRDALDVTSIGDGNRSYVPGLRGTTGTATLLYDTSIGSGELKLWNAIFGTIGCDSTPTPTPAPTPDPTPCVPVDPSDYKYVRFVGKATITGHDAEAYPGSFSGAWIDPNTGDIETEWLEFTSHANLGTAYGARGVQGGGAYFILPQLTCADGTYTDDGNTTTWTPTTNYSVGSGDNPNCPGEYGDDYPNVILGTRWRARVELSTEYFRSYGNFPLILGGLVVDQRLYSPVPSSTQPRYLSVDINPGVGFSQPRKAVIEGHWEFSNDGSTVETTWSGLDDDGNDIDCLPTPTPTPTPTPSPSGSLAPVKFVFDNCSGSKGQIEFDAIITSWTHGISVGELQSVTVQFQGSGPVTVDYPSVPSPTPTPEPTPPPCVPVDPSDYRYVRYTGTFRQSGAKANGVLSTESDPSLTSITTRWFERLTNNGNEYMYLGGLYALYGPSTASTWGPADDMMDPTSDDYTPDVANAVQNYQPYANDDGEDFKWKASYKLTLNDIVWSTLNFHRLPFGDLGGFGYSVKNVATPHLTSGEFSVFPNFTYTTNTLEPSGLVTFELNGQWEFSNDGVTAETTWSGLDDDGNDIDCPSPCVPVNPDDYQYVRYVGKATIVNSPDIDCYRDGGSFFSNFRGPYIDDEGNIQTRWYERVSDNAKLYLGCAKARTQWAGGYVHSAPISYYYFPDNPCGITRVNYDVNGIWRYTEFTDFVNWYQPEGGAYVYPKYRVSATCGSGSSGGPEGIAWRASAYYKTTGLDITFRVSNDEGITSINIGDIGGSGYNIAGTSTQLKLRPNQFPFNYEVDSEFVCSVHCPPEYTDYCDPLRPVVQDASERAVYINGHWEFSNDGVTVEATWSGVDDDGNDIDCP